MAPSRSVSARWLTAAATAGFALSLIGCGGGGPPATGTQVQEPPPIPKDMDPVKQRAAAPVPDAK